MSVSTTVAIGWPVPTGLKVTEKKNGAGKIATFSWDKLLDPDLISSGLDPSGGGFNDIHWRVKINNESYLVYNNPVFSISVPTDIGQCETCVTVQTIYDISNVEYLFGDIATSEFTGDPVCVKNVRDLYCRKMYKKQHPNIRNTRKNNSSSNMRYARAIRMGGKNAFR